MLQGLDAEFPNDPEMVRMTAEVLELSFRNDIEASGFPNFSELKCSLGETDNVTPTLVKVTERCIFPDGGTSIQHLQVFNGAQGWRVIGVLD